MSDFTFIIQGPYNPTHLLMLGNLKKEGKVVLSCYMSDLDKISDPSVYDMIILNDIIDTNIEKIYNYDNVYHQVRSTKRALCSINTEYVVKFRSDSFYSGIPYVIDSIRKNSEKLSCVPININPQWPYQFCDHVMGGKTTNLKNTFEIAESLILNKEFIYDNIDTRLCPVVLLFVAWLKSKKITGNVPIFTYWISATNDSDPRMAWSPDKKITVTVYNNYIETIINNINILDIYNMEPFFAKSNTAKKTFTKAIDAISWHDSECKTGYKMRDMNSYIKAFYECHSEVTKNFIKPVTYYIK